MYFNKSALLTVLNHRIEKYQEQLKSIRKNFNTLIKKTIKKR